MSDVSPTPLSSAPEATVLLEARKVLGAVSEPVRCGILRLLAGGAVLSVNDLAAALGRGADVVSKHLRVLREARLIMPADSPDGDGRKQCHVIPPVFRVKDAAGRDVIDYGTVLLRF